jgi:hypothetical protein
MFEKLKQANKLMFQLSGNCTGDLFEIESDLDSVGWLPLVSVMLNTQILTCKQNISALLLNLTIFSLNSYHIYK